MGKVTSRIGDFSVELTVRARTYSWFWGGLGLQPVRAKVKVYERRRVRVLFWTTVKKISRNASITLRGQWGEEQGRTELPFESCQSCSTLSSRNTWVGGIVPSWAGGGAIKAVGYVASISSAEGQIELRCHWGLAQFIDVEYRCE